MTAETRTIAMVLYPGMTALDIIGPTQVFDALALMRPEFSVVSVSAQDAPIRTDTAVSLLAGRRFAELADPAIVVVPGGGAPTFAASTDPELLEYLRSASRGAELTMSVCTGSIVLGAAGLLEGRRATTHWAAIDLLAEFGATPVRDRWVSDGPVLTAAGVSAGIDAALHVVETLADAEVARTIQYSIEYDPRPPLGGLDWADAPYRPWHAVMAGMVEGGLADHPQYRDRLLARLRS